jgi:hypothetical protein
MVGMFLFFYIVRYLRYRELQRDKAPDWVNGPNKTLSCFDL